MLEEARKKLQKEMDSNKSNSYVQVVGQFLLQHLEDHSKSAKKILAEDKTIVKSLDAMEKEARKKKVGNCAVLTDQEGFSIVLKYFGINAAYTSATQVTVPKQNPEPQPSKTAAFDISLEDLL